jgi:N-methylhydantoinase B/oxoprolinase/acetone carboxylase alpha subunit
MAHSMHFIPTVATEVEINTGDVIRIHTANGAGYGDPRRRPKVKALEDLRLGFLTPERAREIYGLTDADIDNGKADT